MRWKWRIGLFLTVAIEVPFLLWIGVALGQPPEIVLYAGGILTLVLIAMLLMRPFLFGMVSLWLGGVLGASWYFLQYVPPAFALGLGATLSSIVSAIGAPLARRGLGLVLRRRLT